MSETIVLTANKSIYVDSISPSNSVNVSPIKLQLSDTSKGIKKAFLTFDTSLLKQGKKIQSQTLKLYLTAKSSENIDLDYKYIGAFTFLPNKAPSIEDITYANTDVLGQFDFMGSIDIGESTINSYQSINLGFYSNAYAGMRKTSLSDVLGVDIAESFTGPKSYNIGVEFAGADSLYPPKMEVVQVDVDAYIIGVTPTGGFVDNTKESIFSWDVATYDSSEVWGELQPATAKFRWKEKNAVEYTEIAVIGASYSVPANTFSSGDIQWQVEVTTNAGTTAVSPVYTVTTTDTIAIASPFSPLNQKLNRNEANEFKWEHSTSNGTLQTAADLQYSTDEVYWENLISVTGSEQSVVVPANSLPIGTVYWRVRTYNANGVAGEWSEAAVILVEGSVVPVVSSVSNEAFVNVMWTAELQQGYEIVIENDNETYKSGVQLGTEKQYRFKKPLADGSYTAKVRVYYNNGETSPWAEYPFLLSSEKPTAPIISASPIINGIKIDVISENDVYILRNGEVIGKATNGEFTDYSATGENLYTARAVNESYNIADSLAIKASPVIVGSVIATADKPEKTLQLSLNLNGQPQREFSWEQLGGITHYAGRKYPVYEHAEQESESYNFTFAFRTREEYEKFINLAKQKKPMLYRDQYGLKVYGIITGVSPSVSWAGYAVTFSVTKIDYNEAVEYDL